MLSGNILTEYAAGDEITIYAGMGKITRYPGITEQYFAFGAAPGGYQVGNPSLDPEEKYEVDVGARYGNDRIKAEVSVFAAGDEVPAPGRYVYITAKYDL
ncbi:MAG: TonB-dependent receptor [Verrucomicrobia bacterium]|nr:TonB-dependent receptor [Verrucomicrobiota bacterium]